MALLLRKIFKKLKLETRKTKGKQIVNSKNKTVYTLTNKMQQLAKLA